MTPTSNEKTQASVRTWLPVATLAIGVIIWGVRLEGKINTHIAVDSQDAIHFKESLDRIERDGKATAKAVNDIKDWLMKTP